MSRAREKEATVNYRTLNMSALKRESGLQPGARFNWSWWRRGEKVASIEITIETRHTMRLRYQSRSRDRDPVQHDYPVPITWTPCHLGGERPWFLCPSCDRRVGKLYSGSVFACRHCMRLNYPSQQASKRDRALAQAWTLRRRLGCDDGPFEYPAEYIRRPKGMHRATFAKRIGKLVRIELQAVANVETFIAALERTTGRTLRVR